MDEAWEKEKSAFEEAGLVISPPFHEFIGSFGGDHRQIREFLELGALLNRHQVHQWDSLTQEVQIRTLMRIGDREALGPAAREPGVVEPTGYRQDGFWWRREESGLADRAMASYSLALRVASDPAYIMELGCLFLQRMGIEVHLGDELPQCCANPRAEEPYVSKTLHDALGTTQLALQAPTLAELALEAFTRSTSFYWHYGEALDAKAAEGIDPSLASMGRSRTARWAEGIDMACSCARCWLSFDGMRISLETLGQVDRLWMLAQHAGEIYNDPRMDLIADHPYLEYILTGVRMSLAQTMGRWQGAFLGRDRTRKRLLAQIPWFDRLHQAGEFFVDAEWQRTLLKDPTYNPTGIVKAYCDSVEAILRRRLGTVLDAYLATMPGQESEPVRTKFLTDKARGRTWTFSDLTIGQWGQHLKDREFKQFLAAAGGDSSYLLQELPRLLPPYVTNYRNQAAHATGRQFSTEDIEAVRAQTLAILDAVSDITLQFRGTP